MIEKLIVLETEKPILFFGARHKNLHLIQKHLPQVKIIARGNEIKIIGEELEVEYAFKKINELISFFNKFKELSEQKILYFFNDQSSYSNMEEITIIHNNEGKPIKAYTPNQKKLIEISTQNDLVIVTGPAGSGKTYTAIALAVKALKNREIKRIILSRPAVEAGENLGYLPGNLKDKLDPYLQPLYDALLDMIPRKKLEEYIEDGIIEIAPLAYMRGRTLDYAFVILDEAQNATTLQLKMFLTRMGKNAKFIITGDITQIDLNHKQQSGLYIATQILKDIEGIGIIEFNELDIVRHKLVKDIVKAYDKFQNNK
ncbi:MAG: PhoH family protein [Bacteroidales bacterium]|nr:PhoH family protein [Bacteroidales bacterium]